MDRSDTSASKGNLYIWLFSSLYWNQGNFIQTNCHTRHLLNLTDLFLIRCPPDLGCFRPYPSLGSRSHLSLFSNPSLMTPSGHDPFFLLLPMVPPWGFFQSLPQIVLCGQISIPKQRSPPWEQWHYSISAYLLSAPAITVTDLPLSPSAPLNSGVRRKKLDLCSALLESCCSGSLMLVASLQRNPLLSFFFHSFFCGSRPIKIIFCACFYFPSRKPGLYDYLVLLLKS